MAKEKKTVDYFPFYVKDGKTLYVLQKEFGLSGIGFFTQLFRYLSQIPEHWVCLQEKFDIQRFFDFVGEDEEKCINMLSLLASTGKIDRELWENKSIVVSEDFLDSLSRLYSRRSQVLNIEIIRKKAENLPDYTVYNMYTSCAQYVRNMHTSCTHIVKKSAYSKVKESKVKERKENGCEQGISHENIVFDFHKALHGEFPPPLYDYSKDIEKARSYFQAICGFSEEKYKELKKVMDYYLITPMWHNTKDKDCKTLSKAEMSFSSFIGNLKQIIQHMAESREQEEKNVEETEGRKCEKCGYRITGTLHYCPECRRREVQEERETEEDPPFVFNPRGSPKT